MSLAEADEERRKEATRRQKHRGGQPCQRDGFSLTHLVTARKPNI